MKLADRYALALLLATATLLLCSPSLSAADFSADRVLDTASPGSTMNLQAAPTDSDSPIDVATVNAPCTGDGVYLYEHAAFSGTCHKFTDSDPDLSLSAFNDMASSIKLAGSYGGGRYVAILYEHIEYAGASTKFGADDPDLGNDAIGHDNASSLRIIEVPPAPCTGDGVYLYEHPDYAGRCRKFTASDPDLLAVAFNDIASSIKLAGSYGGGRYVAVLYEHIEYAGASTKFGADDPDLGNDAVGHDDASSLQIIEVPPAPCTGDGVYLYEHPDYAGRCRKFTASDPDLLSVAFNDMASSIKFAGSYGGGRYVAILYEHIEYAGASTKFGADDPDLDNDAIGHDNASSLRITEVPPAPCTGDGVYLYEHLDYAGRCRKFTASDPDLLSVAFNDIASSIKFAGSYGGGRYVATLYADIEYGGAWTVFRVDDPDLGNDAIDHDNASSLRLIQVPPSPCTGDGVYLYEHPNYAGRCRKFTASEPDLLSVAFNDIASSIKFAGTYADGRYVAALYENVEYAGASAKFGADDPDLGNDAIGHDNASSLQIIEVPPAPCTGDGVYLYEHLDYAGRCRKFTASEPDLLSVAFNDMASSIKFAGSYGGGRFAATLYADVEYAGASTQFGTDDPNLGNDAIGNDSVSSLRIERIYDQAIVLDSNRGNLPAASDSQFVVGSNPTLDRFMFSGGEPIRFTVEVDRVVGRTDSNGHLLDPEKLVDDGIVPPKIKLLISAFDVDSGYDGGDVRAESDVVFVNGHRVGQLTGNDGAWSVTQLEVDVSHLKFGIPTCREYDGATPPDDLSVCETAPRPGENEIRIDIDTANQDPVWGVGVDWSAFIFEAARPILLVHGRGGSLDGSEPCTKPGSGDGCDYWDKVDNLFYFGFRGMLNSAGFLTANTENYLGGETSIDENANRLKPVIARLKQRYGVDKINIVAHSKGGLDSRGYISDNSLNSENDVATLITLGSPHHGSYMGDLGSKLPDIVLSWFGRKNSDAMKNLSEKYMDATFNPSHPARAGVRYYTVFGSVAKTCKFAFWSWTCSDNRQEESLPAEKAAGAVIAFRILLKSGDYKGINDYLVTVRSASFHEILGHTSRNTTEFGPYFLNHHAIRAGMALRGQRDLTVANLIGDLLDIRPDTVARTASQLSMHVAGTTATDTGSGLAVESGVITQGQTLSYPIAIDTESDVSILLLWNAGDLHLDLVDPMGTIFTPTTGSETVAYAEDRVGGSLDALSMEGRWATYNLIAPQPGLWSARIMAADELPGGQANWIVLVPQESNVTVDIEPDASWKAVNAPVLLRSAVKADGAPVLNATVEASIIAPDGNLQLLTMLDDGNHSDGAANDGVYGTSFVPAQYGIHALSAKATGVSDGIPFSRSAVNELQIAPGTASFAGTYGDQAVDANGDGLYDRLRIDVPLAVTSDGHFMITGELRSSEDALLATANASAELNAGQQTLSLNFSSDQIWSARGSGAFTLSNLILLDMKASELPLRVDFAEEPYTTKQYESNEFMRPAVMLTGVTRDYGVDADSNDRFDELVIEVEIDFQVAGDYVWSGQLMDTAGNDLGRYDGDGTFEPGLQTVDLRFKGETIGDSGRNGPYYLVDLAIWGEGGGLTVVDVAETTAYAYRQFETTQPDDGDPDQFYLPLVQNR